MPCSRLSLAQRATADAVDALARDTTQKAIEAALAHDSAAKTIQAALAAKAARGKPAALSSSVGSPRRESTIFWALFLLALLPALLALVLQLKAAAPSPTAPIVAEAASGKACLLEVGKLCLKLPAKGRIVT